MPGVTTLSAACSGFLFGLATGAQFIESGKHKKVLVVGGDKMSAITNYKDRATLYYFWGWLRRSAVRT